MELIMERTRGLTMTDEEKARMRQEEMTAKIRGLVQKFLDGMLKDERMKQGLVGAGEKDPEMGRRILMEELKGRLAPGRDNAPVLAIMEKFVGLDTGPVQALLTEFEEKVRAERAGQFEKSADRLRAMGISGSAVVPNLNADPEWTERRRKIRGEFLEKFETEVNEG
jgi:hypothetical protein